MTLNFQAQRRCKNRKWSTAANVAERLKEKWPQGHWLWLDVENLHLGNDLDNEDVVEIIGQSTELNKGGGMRR